MFFRYAQTFDEAPHWQLLKEVLTHVFATPKRHHRSKPFFDHVIGFSVADGRVWLRNYQVQILGTARREVRCAHEDRREESLLLRNSPGDSVCNLSLRLIACWSDRLPRSL